MDYFTEGSVMRNLIILNVVLCALLSFTSSSFAWNQSVEIGYGYSHDPNHTKYNNSGVLLSGDLYPIYRNNWSFWSLVGGIGQWHSTAPVNQNLTTADLGLGLRLYPFSYAYQPYVLLSAAPAYLSNRRFGLNTQAGQVSIQSNVGVGVEMNPIDINLRLEHFSNAGLGKPNEGFNIQYLLSIGYLFNC